MEHLNLDLLNYHKYMFNSSTYIICIIFISLLTQSALLKAKTKSKQAGAELCQAQGKLELALQIII